MKKEDKDEQTLMERLLPHAACQPSGNGTAVHRKCEHGYCHRREDA